MENVNSYIKMIDGFAGSDPLRILYDLGFKPEDVKDSIINGLSPFLKNESHLKKDAINLAGIWCGILTSGKNDSDFKGKIFSILSILNDAYDSDRDASMDCIRFWMPFILQSGSRFWSQLKGQQARDTLSLEDFLEEALSGIGKSIEGLSKPYLCMLLHLNKIKDRKAKADEFAKIGKLDLGNIVEELISNADLSDLLILKLYNLKLHNWRNIAYHHNSKIKSGEIEIAVKSKTQEFSFTISRKELHEVSLQVYNVFKALKLALDLFVEDHLDRESTWLNNNNDIVVRDEAMLNDFRISLSSQGFKIESMNESGLKTIRMVLSDLGEDIPVRVRAIHSSQFLHSLWLFSGKENLEIEYRTRKGEPVLISTVSSQVCEKLHSEKDIAKMAEHVNFSFINANLLEENNPFANLLNKISPELYNERYYSQEQEEISIDTYIYKLALSIFSDYLVLLAEGATFETIQLKYSNEGCSLIAKIDGKNILTKIPAAIKLPELKKILSECVNRTIEHYKSSTLEKKFISEAKENNMYLTKRALIRQILDNQ